MTQRNPQAFVRGLMHSDGSRDMANQRVADRIYAYPRYWFSNRSSQIIQLLCDHLDMLGIAWTKPRETGVQVARSDAVAAMDRFVGPKA
jgi:hypothetical protein